jgi:hypothetical protein
MAMKENLVMKCYRQGWAFLRCRFPERQNGQNAFQPPPFRKIRRPPLIALAIRSMSYMVVLTGPAPDEEFNDGNFIELFRPF